MKVYYQSVNAENRYKPNKQIRFKTSMLRSDLCDYNDTFAVFEVKIIVTDPDNDVYDKKLAFQ